jgi:hypothetical protein
VVVVVEMGVGVLLGPHGSKPFHPRGSGGGGSKIGNLLEKKGKVSLFRALNFPQTPQSSLQFSNLLQSQIENKTFPCSLPPFFLSLSPKSKHKSISQ